MNRCERCKHDIVEHILVNVGPRSYRTPDDIYYNTEFETRCTHWDWAKKVKCECRYLEVK